MDKKYRKQYRKSGDKRNRIGIPIGIHDCDGTELKVGDKIKWGKYDGIILWNKSTVLNAKFILEGIKDTPTIIEADK